MAQDQARKDEQRQQPRAQGKFCDPYFFTVFVFCPVCFLEDTMVYHAHANKSDALLVQANNGTRQPLVGGKGKGRRKGRGGNMAVQ